MLNIWQQQCRAIARVTLVAHEPMETKAFFQPFEVRIAFSCIDNVHTIYSQIRQTYLYRNSLEYEFYFMLLIQM